MKVLEVMDGISAARDNVPLAQIAINWAAQKDYVSTCIVGAQSRGKILENSAGFDWNLTDSEIETLDRAIETYLGED